MGVFKVINDVRFQRDYDPEHIAAFLYHKPNCSKTEPLEIVYDTFTTVSGGGFSASSGGSILRCSECRGSE